MSRVLDLVSDHPVREYASGETLIQQGAAAALLVLIEGTLVVERSGERIAVIDTPGAVVGEISMLLDVPATAAVVADGAARAHVVEDAAALLADAAAVGELARLLAARLQSMVGYLVDVKQQFAEASGHISIVDDVLTRLAHTPSDVIEPGSERDPDPLY